VNRESFWSGTARVWHHFDCFLTSSQKEVVIEKDKYSFRGKFNRPFGFYSIVKMANILQASRSAGYSGTIKILMTCKKVDNGLTPQ